jgi:hypothetical protein
MCALEDGVEVEPGDDGDGMEAWHGVAQAKKRARGTDA